MGMSVGGSSEEGSPMMEMNTTPLIDVMLVMLVMLIITIPIMTHATKLDMPTNRNPPPPTERPEVVDVEVDFDGTIVYNGTPVSMEQLESYFRQQAAKPVQPEIHLRPDRRARYGVVAQVLASAQRNDLKKMGFKNVAEFRD
jgi:biopolymer transport protein ExbD